MSRNLKPNEPHPAAFDAKKWIADLGDLEIAIWRECLASTAMSGNRNAELCSDTLERLVKGEPVSDRYVLGLAWTIRAGMEAKKG